MTDRRRYRRFACQCPLCERASMYDAATRDKRADVALAYDGTPTGGRGSDAKLKQRVDPELPTKTHTIHIPKA